MANPAIPFELDRRLAGDTLPVAPMDSGPLLLMNDRRWPGLILVPAMISNGVGAVELHDLAPETARRVHEETDQVSAALKQVTGCTKINSGALGNVVRQLHVHVIARSEGDANWPGPVWGFGERVAWEMDEARGFIDKIRTALGR